MSLAKLSSTSISMPLPVVLVTVFGVGLIAGILLGILAVAYGFDRGQERADAQRAADTFHVESQYGPPLFPPGLQRPPLQAN